MESATWCRTPAAASAARRLRPEVSKNSNTALASNDGELARSITTHVPAMAPLRPSPVMVLTPVLGEAATTSWPPWRRMATVLEPIRPVPPITTIFIANLLVRSPRVGVCNGCAARPRHPAEHNELEEAPRVSPPLDPRRGHARLRIASPPGAASGMVTMRGGRAHQQRLDHADDLRAV